MQFKPRTRTYTIRATAVSALAATLLLATALRAEGPLDNLSDDDIERGERLFNAHCAICHSIGGTGGKGPDLTVQPFQRVDSDTQLVRIMRTGLPGTEMPGAWMLTTEDSRAMAGYVRSLARVAEVKLPGNPKRGRELYEASDCSNCHIIAGRGRGLGPELTRIGAQRNAEYIRHALARPEADVDERWAVVRAETDDGDRVEGIRVNEDAFTVQLRDFDGNLHSFRKPDLQSYRLLRGRTLMTSYATQFSNEELDDLVAYLATLRGEEE